MGAPPTLPADSTTARKLHLLLKKSNRIGNRVRLRFSMALLSLCESNLHRLLGYASIEQYAEKHFGFHRTRTLETLRVARSLRGLSRLVEAFCAGEVSWSVLRELTRIAAPETEEEWLDFARGKSFRHLQAEVQDALRKGRPRPRRNDGGLPGINVKLILELSPEENELVERALEKVAAELSESLGGQPVDVKAALLFAMRIILGMESPGVEREDSPYLVLYRLCRRCRNPQVMTSEGPVEVPPEVVERVEDGARKAEILPEEETPPAAAAAPASPPERPIDRPNTPALLRKLHLRDGRQCSSPFCRTRSELQGHHLEPRAEGGRTKLWNEVLLCKRCHAAVELGYLQIRGTPAEGLVFSTRADSIDSAVEADREEVSRIPVVLVQGEARAGSARVNGDDERAQGLERILRRVFEALRALRYSVKEARERLARVREALRGAASLPAEGDVLRLALAMRS
jgi:hypothetical protein